jgi:hypothetical protein
MTNYIIQPAVNCFFIQLTENCLLYLFKKNTVQKKKHLFEVNVILQCSVTHPHDFSEILLKMLQNNWYHEFTEGSLMTSLSQILHNLQCSWLLIIYTLYHLYYDFAQIAAIFAFAQESVKIPQHVHLAYSRYLTWHTWHILTYNNKHFAT